MDGVDSQEKTREWLEEILESYHQKECLGSKVTVLDFDIGPGLATGEGRLSTLSDLLSLSVSYKINKPNQPTSSTEVEKTENLLIKIPPNDLNDRQIASLAQVDRREIQFYTEALPKLEDWARSRNFSVKIAVPRCFHAKYHDNRNAPLPETKEKEPEPAPEPEPPSEQEQSNGVPEPEAAQVEAEAEHNASNNSNEEPVLAADLPVPRPPPLPLSLSSATDSVLVLEDMRPSGYSMRDFNQGLTLHEARAALSQIAVVHALSWAMQEAAGDEKGLTEDPSFSCTYRPHKAASAYKSMIEVGFPSLQEFLSSGVYEDGKDLLKRLEALHPKAIELLYQLLRPEGSSPSALVHMDFWCNNLLFKGEGKGVECALLDWQMMAVSRPTHDVALLMFTSLTPELRKEHGQDLLKAYFEVFQATASGVGVEVPFGFEVIQEEFKKSQLLALLLVVGSIDLALESEGTERRLIEALRDMAKEELI